MTDQNNQVSRSSPDRPAQQTQERQNPNAQQQNCCGSVPQSTGKPEGEATTRLPGANRPSQSDQNTNRLGPDSGNGRGHDLGNGQQGDARQAVGTNDAEPSDDTEAHRIAPMTAD